MTIFSAQRIHVMIGNRYRLIGGILFGILVGLCLPAHIQPRLRAVIAWDTAALVYLCLAFIVMARTTSPESLKKSAASEDQSRWMILVLMTGASFVSLIAIGTLLSTTKGLAPLTAQLHLMLGAVTVLASWSMMHMVFAVHYAHEYYGDNDSKSETGYQAIQGLEFPGGKEPVFSDFVYYSFVVGMTCQVSDVQVSSTAMRRLTLSHGVLAFFFNTVVLALSVNIAAGLLS